MKNWFRKAWLNFANFMADKESQFDQGIIWAVKEICCHRQTPHELKLQMENAMHYGQYHDFEMGVSEALVTLEHTFGIKKPYWAPVNTGIQLDYPYLARSTLSNGEIPIVAYAKLIELQIEWFFCHSDEKVPFRIIAVVPIKDLI